MYYPPKLPFRCRHRIAQKASFSLKLCQNQTVTVDSDIEILEVASSDDDLRSDRSSDSDLEDEETRITRKSLASDYRYRMKLPPTSPYWRGRILGQLASMSQHPCHNQTVNSVVEILEVSSSSDEVQSNPGANQCTKINILEVTKSSDECQQVDTFDQLISSSKACQNQTV